MSPAPPAPVGLDEVLRHPHRVAERLAAPGTIYGLTGIDVRVATVDLVCFWLTLEPWAGPAAENYPTEQVAITVRRSGDIAAVPVNARARLWLHRNPTCDFSRWGSMRRMLFQSAPAAVRDEVRLHDLVLGDVGLFGGLCLWFPDDPRELRWEWSDGLDAYVTIVHRHLQAEEFWRRNRRWPAEDAPHGPGAHPIRTEAMRLAALQGAA